MPRDHLHDNAALFDRKRRACKGAIASIYSSWKKDHDEWASSFEFARGPVPVPLCVTSDATGLDGCSGI